MDRDLVVAAQRGDQAAFVDLMRTRIDRYFTLAHRVLRDVDRAEDALQDALVIAWRDLRGLRDPDRFDAWLHRIVVRECIDQASRERRRTANLRVLPVDDRVAPDDLLTLADRDRWDRAGSGDWEQPGVAAGTTVDDLVAALRANASYTSSAPVPVPIGGYAGKRVDLQLPADLDFTTCDKVTGRPGEPVQAQGNFFVFTGQEAGLHAQGPANRWQVSIIDVRGNRVVIVVDDYAGTSAADRATAQSILDSFQITP